MYLAPLNYDRFFKKVFSDLEIAKQFLEDFLDVTINEIDFLKTKNKITDDAAPVEFDFRCKIGEKYVVIDMQQWYKPDIVKRFYLYHAVHTSLQLEDIPEKVIKIDKNGVVKEVKDYNSLEPVISLIWMVDDMLGFLDENYVTFTLTPENISDFLKDNIWELKDMKKLMEERERLLKLLQNNAKNMTFLYENKLTFMLQKNIVKNIVLNKKETKYERWFEFANKTLDENNKEEDFVKFNDDVTFKRIMKRLSRNELTDADIKYINNEKEIVEKVNRYEAALLKEGRKEGREEGREEEKKAYILKLFSKGKSCEEISELTDISKNIIEEYIKSSKENN